MKFNLKDRPDMVMGVDPAFRKGGFYACIIDTKAKTAKFLKFRDVLDFDRRLRNAEFDGVARIGIENANAQNVTFKDSDSKGVGKRFSRDAGKNMAVSELALLAAADRIGSTNVLGITPVQKGKKIPEEYFSEYSKGYSLIGYKGSQDERDAFKIAILTMNYL